VANRRSAWLPAGIAVAALLISACASTGGGGANSANSAVPVGLLGPLSGARASVGAEYTTGADLAQAVINSHGGVLGHKVSLVVQDDAADPGDAVPAAQKELEVSHVVAMIGPEAITASVVLPLADKANIPDLIAGGGAEFDSITDPHFFRMSPSDTEQAAAMVIYAHSKGWNKVALAIGNTSVDQSLTPGLVATARDLGMTITNQVTITLGATSFRSEIQTLFSQHPQAILGQFDIPSAAVVFGELAQEGLTSTPWVASNLWYTDQFVTAVGPKVAGGNIYIANPSSAGPGVPPFQAALKKYNPSIKGANDDAQLMWDGLTVWALGADEAGTWKWPAIETGILKVANGPGTACYDYATCYGLIKQGKAINFNGAASSVDFNKYHNVFGPFSILQYSPGTKSFSQLELLNADQIENATKPK
jgi:ABC-type branched-subunit amino acid transport system substrate-binding protein